MHSSLVSSRALLLGSVLAVAAAAHAQAPAGALPPPSGPSEAALLQAGGARIPGAVRATARAKLAGGELALLVAYQPRAASAKAGFVLLVFAADGSAAPVMLAHDQLEGIDAAGTPSVALSATALPVAPGALVATVGSKGTDGSGQERSFVHRFGGGRLSRLLALSPGRTAAAGSGRPTVVHELELLRTATSGYKDLRERTRTLECGDAADCAERIEVSSYTFDGVRYAVRPHAIPFVEEISASSELNEPGGLVDYSAGAAVDGRLDTAWCEGAKGAGWFEKLELTFVPAEQVKALTIVPGRGAGDEFLERSRPKRIRVLLPDGRKIEAGLADEPKAQRVALPEGERIFGLTVVIVDVYKGKRDDACITELELEVEP